MRTIHTGARFGHMSSWEYLLQKITCLGGSREAAVSAHGVLKKLVRNKKTMRLSGLIVLNPRYINKKKVGPSGFEIDNHHSPGTLLCGEPKVVSTVSMRLL